MYAPGSVPTEEYVREVRDGEKGVLVEDIALEEPLQQVPRHWVWRRSGGRQDWGTGGRDQTVGRQRSHALLVIIGIGLFRQRQS